jgi:uncharacterized NAD-dependent epimerase/dehydratase family protein
MKILIHHFDQNAHAILRFGKDVEVIGIYDERKKFHGVDPGLYLGLGATGLEISGNFEALLKAHGKEADMLVTTGEGLYFTKQSHVQEWKKHVEMAIRAGLDVYSMSKVFYGEKTEDLKRLAEKHGVRFIEASDPNAFSKYEKYALLAQEDGIKTPVVNFTGTSMNSGKVTAMMTVKEFIAKQGVRVCVLGTEPSSLFIGADEQVVPEVLPTMRGAHAILGAIKKIELEKKPDVILVGNQTGLRASVTDVREARAGAIVAWQILLGSQPQKVVLCSKWSNIPEISAHIELIKHSINVPVSALVINGLGCNKERLLNIINDVEKRFGILTLDIISTPERLHALAEAIIPK